MTSRRRNPVASEAVTAGGCSVQHRLEILHGVAFFRALSPCDLEAINARFRAIGFEPRETIYRAGDSAERLFVLAHGKVKLLRRTVTGQDVLLDILAPGEMFGSLAVLGDREYPDDAEALTSSCVLGIDSGDFQDILARYPQVAMAVVGVLATRLQAAHEAISQLSAMPVEVRVAASLLKLAEKLGVPHDGGVLIQAPLSRQDLAAMTGATTESVSRVMSQFRRDGLITSGREWVAITDASALAAITEIPA